MLVRKFRIKLWHFLVTLYANYLRLRFKMDIGRGCMVSWNAHLDKSVNPTGIHLGDNTRVLNGAMILSHDDCRRLKSDTYVGKNCVIGVRSIILPGVTVGNSSIVSAGAVVTKDVPSHCIVAGNPAKIKKTDIEVNDRGFIVNHGKKFEQL